jgi:uncharacterized protein YjbJ (UPF0337 family)
MNKSTAAGKFDQIKGKMKQGLGEAMDNDRMANSGTMDQVKGNAKEAWGSTKDAARSGSRDSQETASVSPADERMRDDKHNLRNSVTSAAKGAKDAVTDRVDDFKHRRSA